MEAANSLPWPSIEQLPREICSRISRFLDDAERAAVAIQQWWRQKRADSGGQKQSVAKPDCSQFVGPNRHALHSLLLKAPAASSEKLDGTNVAKSCSGKLLGRRLAIEDSAKSYQGCPLGPLRELNTVPCLDELCAIFAPTREGLTDCAVYGELCCNPGLYSYQTRELPQTWQLFGAIFEFDSSERAVAAAAKGREHGLVCVASTRSVRVCNSPALAAFFQRHGLPYIDSETYPSICHLVAQKRQWMTEEKGEGMVLGVNHGSESESFKWKISREHQPGTVAQLAALLSALRPGGPSHSLALLLSPEIHSLVADLYAVATHVDSTAVSEPKKGGKGGKAPRIVDPRAVQVALASALTKFDSLDASFQRAGRDAVPGLVGRLSLEIVQDKELELPAEGAEARAAAEKEVEGDVRRFVTAAFGQWQSRSRRPM